MAVLLVLVYHAGVTRLPGGFVGVDVFFVVSGFVITNQLLRELESTGRLSLVRFYSRRAKRLLPASALVLVVTAVASWLLASRVQWQQIGGDIVGAGAYVVNWVFSARSVDYLAEDVAPSPVLHYWSLAVEEQFYVVWPLVMLGIFAFLRRRARASAAGTAPPGSDDTGQLRRRRRGTAGPPVARRDLAIGLLAVVVVPSLVASVVDTWWRPEQAFFVTHTRLWELAVGGLVAVGARRWSSWRRGWGMALAWAGLAAVVASGFVVTAGWAWPGLAAALPVLGTAAVIVGGFSASGTGAARLLAWRPLVWVGGLSYSLYLWHWPLLRFWEWQFGTLNVAQGLAVVAFSFLPAWLSFRLVESPVRHAQTLNDHPRYALSVGANCTLASLLCGVLLIQGATLGTAGGAPTGAGWTQAGTTGTGQVGGQGGDGSAQAGGGSEQTGADLGLNGGTGPADAGTGPSGGAGQDASVSGAGLPLPGVEQPGDEPFFDQLTPDPLEATADVPSLYDLGCQRDAGETTSEACEFGDPEGDVVVAVVGDSKAAQWVPAVDTIGQEQGWLVRVYTKESCTFADSLLIIDDEPYTSCRTWGQDVLDRLTTTERPAVVITSGVRSRALPDDGAAEMTQEALTEGYARFWAELNEQDTRVIALSDTPPPGEVGPVYECVEAHREDPSACTWPYEQSPGSRVLQEAVDLVEDAHFVDMDPWVCPGGVCAGVYRHVLTYRQGSHITVTFVSVLTEPLAAYLVPLVEGTP
ncbi:MAG: acyltransferase [Actinomycetales bacterium]|nr:acyltransferase [Actinomycetales bacterium]